MRTKKGLVIYTLAIILVCAVGAGIASGLIKVKASETLEYNLNVKHEISIMCQNLRREYTTKDGVGNNTLVRYYRIQNQFRNYDSDIYCFQECNKAWQWLLDLEFKDDEYHKVVYYNNNGLATPVYAKKSKFDLLDSGYYLLSDKSSSTNSENRIACFAKLQSKYTKETLVVYSGHYAFDKQIQIDSCKNVKEDAKAKNADAYVICGDFNYSMNSNKEAYTIMATDGSKDLAITAGREGIQGVTGGTFHNYGKEESPKRIDFFFGSDNITAKMYTVLNDTYDGKYVSDHYGILTYIDIN